MMINHVRKLDKMAAKVNTLDPVTSVARGREWDAQTLHSWMAANTRFQSVRDVLTAALRCTFGLEPSQMSLLLFLTIVKSAGGVNTLMEATKVKICSIKVPYCTVLYCMMFNYILVLGRCSGVRFRGWSWSYCNKLV